MLAGMKIMDEMEVSEDRRPTGTGLWVLGHVDVESGSEVRGEALTRVSTVEMTCVPHARLF